jgi:hypothetical protein
MFVPYESRRNGKRLQPGTIISEVIDEAIHIIKKDGWLPMNPVLAGKRGTCIAKAIATAAFGRIDYYKVHDTVRTSANAYTGHQWRDLPQFNDAPGRTVADVLEVLKQSKCHAG